jgi:magnesium transporter
VITSYYLVPGGALKQNLDEDEMRAAVRSGEGLLWVNMQKPTPDETFVLDEAFAFHPLAIEDCQHISRYPKLDEYRDHLFLVILAPNPNFRPDKMPGESGNGNGNGDDEATHEVDLFLGRNYVISYYNATLPFVQTLLDRAKRDPKRGLGRGSAFLLHEIVDAAVDQFFAMVDRIEDEVEEAEPKLQEAGREEVLAHLLDLKRRVMGLRRQMSDHREIIQRLMRLNHPVMSQETAPYFRDILDHLNQIEDDLDVCRDTIDAARDVYLAMANTRTNEVMRVMTVMFTLTLPFAILTSWFGMNFKKMPLDDHEHGVWIYTGVMAVLALILFLWIRRRKWF